MNAFVFEVNDDFHVSDCADAVMAVAQTRNAEKRKTNNEREYALFYTKDSGKTIQAMDGLFSIQTSRENLSKEYKSVTPVGSAAFIREWLHEEGEELRFSPFSSMPKCMAEAKDKDRKIFICTGSQYAAKTKKLRGHYVYLFLVTPSGYEKAAFVRKGKDGTKDIVSIYGSNGLQMQFLVVEDCVYVTEWRVFVLGGKVQAVRRYRGEKDRILDSQAVAAFADKIHKSNEYPDSFVMDIGMAKTDTGNEKLFVMGVSPFICCRLYGAYFDSIPDMATASFIVGKEECIDLGKS